MHRRGVFDDEEDFEQQTSSRNSNLNSSKDAEFTLGAGTLLLLFAGLVVMCGVCFGFGYIVGHHGATSTTIQQPASAPAAEQTAASQQKPSATTQTAAPAPAQPALQPDTTPQPASNVQPQPAATVTVPVSPAQAAEQTASRPEVRPALPTASAAPPPAAAYPSHPAVRAAQPQAQIQARASPMPSAVELWVQIAAVSHVEDAQVLTNALMRRGYTVIPRREADNLIHVRIGPFSSRDEAERWRSKLLNDGYNAEIQ